MIHVQSAWDLYRPSVAHREEIARNYSEVDSWDEQTAIFTLDTTRTHTHTRALDDYPAQSLSLQSTRVAPHDRITIVDTTKKVSEQRSVV